MIDKFLFPKIAKPLDKICPFLKKFGAKPNGITIFGLIFAVIAFGAISFGAFHLAIFAILLNRLCDGLDGALARYMDMKSPFGAYLDSCCDFIFYGLIVVAFGFYQANFAIYSAILLCSFLASGISFCNFAIFAQNFDNLAIENANENSKGFYYAFGLMEGFETIAFFIIFCLFPEFFPIISMVFAFLCFATWLGRAILAYYIQKQAIS